MDKQKEQTIPVEGTVTKAEEKKGLFAWIKAHPVKTGVVVASAGALLLKVLSSINSEKAADAEDPVVETTATSD